MRTYLNPVNWFRWTIQFVLAWVLSIRWTGSPWAIPFLVVMLLMAGGSAVAWSSSKTWRNRMIDRKLGEAYRDENYAVVQLLLQRRLRDQPEDRDLKRQLAETLVSLEKRDDAVANFRQLAFEERDGKAAAWLLKNELKISDETEWTPEILREFGSLTEVAIAAFPSDLQINAWRAEFLLRDGKILEAIPHLEALQKVQPMRTLQIAALLRSQGEEKRATEFAERALKDFEERVKDEPRKPELRMALAQVLVFQKQQRKAFNTLFEGYSLTKDERLRAPIAESLVIYAQSLNQEDISPATLKDRLQILQKAIEFAPASPAVIKAVGDTVLAASNEDDAQVVALRNSLIDGSSPSLAHFIRGTVAMMKGDAKTANFELDLAAKDLPQSPAILNNLAVAKAAAAKETSNVDDLEQALQLVNTAIELNSKLPRQGGDQTLYFYETRGQIHLLLKRYSDAISDLEKAISIDALKEQVHGSLADAYEAAEIPEMATMHRQAAETLATTRLQTGVGTSGNSDQPSPKGE